MSTVSARPATASRTALCVSMAMAMAPRIAVPAAPMPGPEPTPVIVPQGLRSHVPMVELSGLAWAPTLDRYLVIVDDSIDTDDNARHGAFLLTLGRNGQLDPEPVPVDGVSAIDDAESLTAGPDNSFFLLTSHAPNKKGNLKKARRQLLRMKLDGRRLKVTGELDLYQGKHDLSEQLAKVGLPKNTPVDIEALTFHDGTLFLGFKAPLLADGAAMIMRLDRPAEAFEKGKLAAGNLYPWSKVHLSVPPAQGEGPPVSEGIADLQFATDGSLYLCANSPKGRPNDGGGALWRVAKPKGDRMEAKLLRRFPGLKPEGVTIAPDGRTLTIVFDRNSSDPLWTSWPLAN
jgi:hypothetical protein